MIGVKTPTGVVGMSGKRTIGSTKLCAGKVFTVSDYLLTRLQQAGLEYLISVPGDYAAAFLNYAEIFKRITNILDFIHLIDKRKR